jgi:hypothetical protein
MPTQGVMDRQRVGEALIAAARTHAQKVGERLQTKLAAFFDDGEPPPDLTRLQLQLARMVEAQLAALVEADGARIAELADDPPARERRDDAAAAVREQIVTIRQVVSAVLGADRAPGLLSLEGPTAENPLVLMRQGRRLLETLRRHGNGLPGPRLRGLQLDLAPATEVLRARLDELSVALRDVAVERRQAKESKRRRDKAVEAFDLLVRRVAGLLVGCYQLADLPELARRIRVSPPKRRVASAADRKES